ncbi:protein PIGBOS1 [Dunckerocampus dactyliophorus]|uniref:protein PIGBOS1 n=1 Tax=Dunckerocampus dactyliophorus TaxID=161453 RepID=UPI00240564FF|nr:protein PIGBOS1 [Dunckerocampus dactyliophorus]
MFRQKIPFTQVAFAAVLGVAGGFYIYRPYYDTVTTISTQQQQNQDMTQKENVPNGKKSC